MDTTNLQSQLTTQIGQIQAALSSGQLSSGVAAALQASQAALQSYLDKLVLGAPLSAGEQQDLQNSLTSSQTALLAARASREQTILFILLGAGIVAVVGILVFRHHLKKKKE